MWHARPDDPVAVGERTIVGATGSREVDVVRAVAGAPPGARGTGDGARRVYDEHDEDRLDLRDTSGRSRVDRPLRLEPLGHRVTGGEP